MMIFWYGVGCIIIGRATRGFVEGVLLQPSLSSLAVRAVSTRPYSTELTQLNWL